MGIYAIKPKFQQTLKPIERVLVRHRVHPTWINIVALVLSLFGGAALFYSNRNLWLLVSIPIIAYVRTACNALDGMVARELKVKHQGFGEVLNETFDRISDAALLFGFALAAYTNLTLGAVATIAVLINSYLSIVSKAAGASRQYGGIMGKADRMIALGLAAVLILATRALWIGNAFFWVVIAGTTITFFQRFAATGRELL